MRRLADALQEFEIDIVAQWVPRELNVVADLLSRQVPLADALRQAQVVLTQAAETGDYLSALDAACPPPLRSTQSTAAAPTSR